MVSSTVHKAICVLGTHDCLSQAMKDSTEVVKALSQLKTRLMDIATKLTTSSSSRNLTACTTSYLMSTEGGCGLVFNKMSGEQALQESSYLQPQEIEEIGLDVFDKVKHLDNLPSSYSYYTCFFPVAHCAGLQSEDIQCLS